MDKRSETKSFNRLSGKDINIRKSESELLEGAKLSRKEVILAIGTVLGSVLGILIVTAVLAGAAFLIFLFISKIKEIIDLLQSYMNNV